MRISVISPFVDRQHGSERALAELLERLATQYQDQIELYAQRVSDLNLKSISVPQGNDDGGIYWHRVRAVPGPHLIQFLAWLFLNRTARRNQENLGKPDDVVFSPGINAFDADVILVHAVFQRVAELQNSQNVGRLRGLHRKLYYALLCSLERRIYKNPQVILAAVSRHTAQQLARYFGRNDVTVIPNGVHGDFFAPAALTTMREKCRQDFHCSPRDFVLLLIGNDWRNKGLATLLEAFSKCADLPLRLLVVGQDEPAPFLAHAENLRIADRIRFLSPAADVRIFYAAADVLVAPSLEDSFNLPVLEAMSSGLPVVVSARAGISEWLSSAQDSLVLQDPENAEELRSAIRTVALDPALRGALAENALQTAKKFSWDTHAGELRKLLVKAAEIKSRRK